MTGVGGPTATSLLLRRAATGLGWVLGSMMAGRVVTFASMLVLARLLSPTDFGVMAVPLLVITYLETVGDLGTGAALVQTQQHRDEAALVTLAFNIAMGAGWWLAMNALAGPVASFFDRVDTLPAMKVLAWVFAIKALGNTQEALLLHDLDFRSRALPEVGRAGVKAVVSIALAFQGQGAWSLVWGQVAGTAAWVVLMWVAVPWRPWRHLHAEGLAHARAALRPMLSFGFQVVLVNVLAAVLHHVDQVVVGRVAGVVALGFYSMAGKLPEVCITTLTWTVGKVAFPAFARSSRDQETRRGVYLVALRFIAALTLPTAVLLAALAEPIVVVSFGPQWQEAAAPLRWLAVAAALRAVGSHAGDLFKGAGRPDLLRNLALLKACVTLPALGAAALTGRADVIAAALAGATLVTSAVNVFVACRVLDMPLAVPLQQVRPALLASATTGAFVFAAGMVTAAWGASADAVVRGGLGVALALATLWLAMPDVRRLASSWRAPASRPEPAP